MMLFEKGLSPIGPGVLQHVHKGSNIPGIVVMTIQFIVALVTIETSNCGGNYLAT